MDTYAQITRPNANTDKISITINSEDGLHVRVEISLVQFAEMITCGGMQKCTVARFRLPENARFTTAHVDSSAAPQPASDSDAPSA